MSDNGTRIVLVVEQVNEKRVIGFAALDCSRYVVERLLCGVHEDLVQSLILTDLVKERAQ